jgi:hypothetical protein
MRVVEETKIDEKCRTSALTGLVRPGERYKVTKRSKVEIRLVRMAVEAPQAPKVSIVRFKGRKLLASDRVMTNADTQGAMEQFP